MKKQIFLIIFLLILSIIPRLWELTTYPPLIVDEPANLRDINDLQAQGGFHPFDFAWDFSQATLIHYPALLLISVGLEEFYALRLTSVILSLLTLIPFFFIVRKRTNDLVAFCITLLFSFSYFYLQFSKVGWTNIHTLFLGISLFWVLDLAIDKKSYLYVLLAGLLAGISMYTYRASEIFILSGFIFLVLNFSKPKEIKDKVKSALIYISSYFIVSLPWLYKIINNWELYNLRSNVVSIKNVPVPYHGLYDKSEIYFYQIITTLKSWILILPNFGGGIENPRYLPMNHTIISIPLIPLFFIGLLIAIFNFKKHYIWLCIFLLGLIFGQILTNDPPNGARGLILLPIIYLFIALALYYVYKKFENNILTKPLILIFTFIVILIDLYIYKDWMTWIKV